MPLDSRGHDAEQPWRRSRFDLAFASERAGGDAEHLGAALKERTRERVPLDWAATQSNLGRAWGGSQAATERLEQAVAAYTEAIKERTRERVPLDWAATQSNRSHALQILRDRGRAY